MGFTDEYLELRKKRKKEQGKNIAPVRSDLNSRYDAMKSQFPHFKSTVDEEESGLDFFDTGAFYDGYQAGDVTKSILGTVGDVAVGVGKGLGSLGEGIVDLAMYGVAGVSDLLGADEFADKTKSAAQFNAMDAFFEDAEDALDHYSILGRTSKGVTEGLGQVAGIILTGGAGAAAGLGSAGVAVLTTGITGLSSMGAGMSEAYQGGADDGEAFTYGALKGTVDAGTELLFGGLGKSVKALGISKGISSLDDIFAKKLSSKISNQFAKNLVQYGVKSSAEGVEEVLAGIGSGVAKKLTYMSDEELSQLVEDENLLEQFVVGAVTSGIAQGGDFTKSVKSGSDFVTGLTSNEEKVVEKEVENRIAAEETNGKKLSGKAKDKIYDEVLNDLEKGYISTDTIESILGGETYTSYKDTIDNEDAAQKEFDALNKMKQGDMTGEQIDRREELRQQLKDIKENSQRDQLKTRLGEEVSEMVKGDRLSESYNEKARRSQAFEADVTQYDAKQQETVQKAIDSGVLNNTNRTREFVDMIAKISADKGVSFDFTDNAKLKESGFALEGKTVNGYVTDSGITINVNSAKAFNSVVGHEITHVLEGTELYDTLQQTLFEYAKSKNDYQGRVDALTALYKDVKGADINAELTADLVGDYLFTDTDFVMKLSTEHRNIFQKIFDEIKYLCKIVTAGSKEARQLERARKVFEEAYRESSKAQKNTAMEGGVRYSLGETTDMEKITANMTDSERAEILRNKRIIAPAYSGDAEAAIANEKELSGQKRSLAKAALVRIGEEFNVFTDYNIEDIDVQISLSRGALRESITKDADPVQLARLLPILKETVENAVGIESHANRYFYDNTTESFDNLLGGYIDGEYFVPVRFGLKRIRGGEAVLYVVVDQQKIEAEVIKTTTHRKDGSTASHSTSAYSIPQIVSFVNSKDLLRYLPDDMLTVDQKQIKQEGIAETVKYTNNKNDAKYAKFIADGNTQAAQSMVDAAAKAAGYTIKAYHGTTNRQEKSTWNQNTRSWDTEYSRITVFKRQYPEQAGHFFNSDIDNAGGYGSDLYPVYLMLKKPLVIDCKGQNYASITFDGKEMDTYEWALYARKQRYDGVVFENISDGAGYDDLSKLTTDYVVFDSNRIKSAETVTYDNDGNVIPLSQRFTPIKNDIRYSLSAENNIASVKGGIYGKDILLAPIGENVVRTQTAPQENIAPVREDVKPQAASPDNLVPVGENVERTGTAEGITPLAEKEETDKDAEQEKIAEILTEEPTPANRKSRAWARFKANFVDKGAAFEDLSLKTKNRELMGKWNYMLYSEARAQQLIGNGADNVKSLNAIREEVDDTGLTKQFYDYLYHKHNVDRMQLSERYEDIPNKPVFGDSVTADVSKEVAEQYESEHPEFQQYAQDVYDYMNHLRQLMVDNGVISQETADLWSEMYPHYVPIRRTGDAGLNINVPLDTGRTGVNAPVKGATGGNSDILPLFDTMGQRTIQTFKAIDKNSFGVELKDTLGTAVASETASVDDAIDSIDVQEGLLQEGKNGRSPTFTVFENGERVTFEISEDMHDALKPVSGGLAYTNKVMNAINNVRRGLLTEYNPTFMLTNAIKDAQDVLLNSQHPMKTYAKLPEAYAQLFRKGYWYKEYVENGGEQNTYFDNKTNTFATENKGLAKLLNTPPLSTISKVNSFIEMAPRLAEYIASREAGRSVEVSMLDAARVTTNFAAGGDVTKFLNRNGATFLNASVQGAMQQIRNVREANMNGIKGWASLATKFVVAGLPALLLNGLIWDDDEEYQELSDYVKQSYYIIGKYDDGKFVRIPKGRTVAVIQNAFEQMQHLITGDDEADFAGFLDLVVSNLAPNNPIDNNILSPIIQAANNETWYGEDLVPSRLQNLPAAEQYDESTDAVSKWLGEKLNISPVKINYLLDQYSGGLGDVFLPMMTPQAESGDNSFIGNMLAPLKDKFTADSVMNNQNVSDFYDTVDELATGAKKSNATDEDVLKYKYINSVNAELSNLYKQKREIQNSDLANDEKYAQIRELQQQIDDVAKDGLSTYGDVTITGDYASVGNRHYKMNDNGEWQKLNDKQVEKMEVFSKVVGGNAAYISRFGDLGAIKSDKDESGEVISGSRKDKVIEYINNLDADYGEKIILFRSQYTGDDTYNYEIIDYLNGRDDISREEMEAILKELGFTVSSDGTVTW